MYILDGHHRKWSTLRWYKTPSHCILSVFILKYWTTDCTSLPVAQIQKTGLSAINPLHTNRSKNLLQRSLCCHLSSGLQKHSELMLRRVKGFEKSDLSSSRKANLSPAPHPSYSPLFLKHSAHTERCHHSHCCVSIFSLLERGQASHFSRSTFGYWGIYSTAQ